MRTYIILGMHNSATSFLAKCLKLGGVNIGENLLQANDEKPDGYYENLDFLNLNEEILRNAGGSWNNPPERRSNS